LKDEIFGKAVNVQFHGVVQWSLRRKAAPGQNPT
jgi:hypothetical protein